MTNGFVKCKGKGYTVKIPNFFKKNIKKVCRYQKWFTFAEKKDGKTR
jgi:hypothetical protein